MNAEIVNVACRAVID